ALINTNSDLQKEKIKWEDPKIDFYALKWDEVSVYPSTEIRNILFRQYVHDNNPNWTEEQINDILRKYSDDNNEDIPSESKFDIELKSDLVKKKNNNKYLQSSISKEQLELDRESIGKNTGGHRIF
ncbi:MAG: hypothetical protein KH290_13675, partial [Roseburia sp.]|nr:hypothetical protein [Roseburia sp.]